VVGVNNSIVKNCYHNGNIRGSLYAGCIVGLNNSTVVNCFFLSGQDVGGIGSGDGLAIEMNADAFASGKVAYLLQAGVDAVNGTIPQIWGQNINNGREEQEFPIFSDAAVYLITDCLGASIDEYSNLEEPLRHTEGTGATCAQKAVCAVCGESYGETLSHTMSYVNNNDGTHDYACEVCGTVVDDNIAHSYDEGECVCGDIEKIPLKGDVNLDGNVDMDDTTLLMRYILKAYDITDETSISLGEVTGDDIINMDDVTKLMRYVLKAIDSL